MNSTMKAKFFISALLLFIGLGNLSAQVGQAEPIDSGWNQLMFERSNAPEMNDSLGGMPSPVKYHFIYPDASIKSGSKVFPSVYDLRTAGPGGTSLLNPVRNQGVCGSCWTFGAYGCMESWLKKSGVGIYNFSENNMKECHGFDYTACYGGNIDMVTAYLARRDGPILDVDDPYVDGVAGCTSGLNEQFYITDVRFLPNIMDTLKQTIMDHGALYTTMYWAAGNYNSTNFTYYYSGGIAYNHIIMLVGWDDTKVTAGGTGAWICQNSWGTSWGQSGFFYISYNDNRINTSVGYFEKKKNISNDLFTLYQIDRLGANGSYGYGDSICYGVIKYVSENNFDIRSISTYAKSSNTKIEISVYDQFSNGVLSGLLVSLPVKTCVHPGYYTFDLATPIVIPQGDDYYIKIKYIAPATTWPAPVETYYSGYAYPLLSGTSWISHTGINNTWYKLENYDLAIKVYASANISARATTLTSPSCYGTNDGAIDLQVWGGQAPYAFSWDTSPVQNTSSISGLSGGTYSCTITDALNKFTVYSFTLVEPDSISTSVLVHDNNPCFGQAVGKIKIFAANTTYTEYFANSVISVSSSENISPSANLTGTADGASWSPMDVSNGEYCTVGYSTPRKINQIKIYERVGSGSVDSVFVRDAANNTWQHVWSGTPYFVENDSVFSISFPLTAYNVDAVKVSLNPTFFPFYPKIDAVGICAPNECSYVWSNEQSGNTIQNLVAGQYTVTITNSEGCQKTESFSISQPDSLFVIAMNDTTLCSGSSISLHAQATASTSWFILGSGTPLVNLVVAPVASVQYVVKAESACGIVYDTVSVDVDIAPFINHLNDTTICSGDNITLNASGSGITNWYLEGNPTPLSELNITPAISSNYVVTAQNGVCTPLSDTMSVEVLMIPEAAGSITGDDMVCQGQNSVSYTVPVIPNTVTYNWTLPGGATGAGNTNSISVNYDASAVSGDIIVYGTNVCGQGSPGSLSVVVNPKPATPIITISGNILHSSASDGNQWYIQGMSIMDATGQEYQATTDGDYYVVVTINGCSSDHSNIITTNFSGIPAVAEIVPVSVYPNPVKNELFILTKEGTESSNFKIINSLGQVVYQGNLVGSACVSTSAFSQGLYLLKLEKGSVIRFVKE